MQSIKRETVELKEERKHKRKYRAIGEKKGKPRTIENEKQKRRKSGNQLETYAYRKGPTRNVERSYPEDEDEVWERNSIKDRVQQKWNRERKRDRQI